MDNKLKEILEKLGVGESLIIKTGDESRVEFRATNIGNLEARVEPLGLATVFARNELNSWLQLLSGFAGGAIEEFTIESHLDSRGNPKGTVETVDEGIAVSASSITDRLVRYLVEARGLDRGKIKVDGHGFVFAAELWTGCAFYVDDANESIQVIVPLEVEVTREDYLLRQLNEFNLVGNISLSHLDGTVYLQVATPASTFVGQHVRWAFDQAISFARFRFANDGLFGGRAPLQKEAVAAIRKLQTERNSNG